MTPPEELDMQAIDNQGCKPFQFLTSLPLVRRGWFANHALQRFEGFGETRRRISFQYQKRKAAGRGYWAAPESTAPRHGVVVCNHRVPCAGSLSLGRWPTARTLIL